jgi:hypothetical protein
MPESIVDLQPFALRPKDGARLAGCGLTEFYKRLNSGRYQSFLDGANRLVIVESIRADQRKLAATSGTPREHPSERSGGPGRPRKKAATGS